MTKKEFVEVVVADLIENPRKVLAGHGIKAAILQEIALRPDVMARLATILYTLKTAKKGAVGLRKASNFVIKAYKNFPEMNMKAREDVETFIAGLSPEDQASFKNSENIVTCLMLGEKGLVTGPEGDDVIPGIVSGQSTLLNFDTAVRKEYKIPGGKYLVIMVGDSAIAPKSQKVALTQAKRNKTRQARRKPAAIIRELKAKANKKLAVLNSKKQQLQNRRRQIIQQQQQRAYLSNQLGGQQDLMYGVGKRNMQANHWQLNRAGALARLTPQDRGVYSAAQKLRAAGNKRAAKSVLGTMQNKQLMRQLAAGNPVTSGDALIAGREKELRNKVAKLTKRLQQLKLDYSLAPVQKRKSVSSMISKTTAELNKLRARLKFVRNKSGWGEDRAAMLAKVNADIEANIAEGASISQALNAAVAKLQVSPQQKQQIKQQAMAQAVTGLPMQYAVQQAIQDVASQQLPNTGLLNDAMDIDDIMAVI